MKSAWFQNVVTGVLCLCALVVTALVVRREFFPPQPAARLMVSQVENWREFARGGRRIGPERARATIVVFSDFQCPFCAVAADRFRALRRQFPEDLAVIHRHFPLPGHPFAEEAARASECAAAQARFEPFHDALFAKQDSIGAIPWIRFAAAAGVGDTAAFRRCTESQLPLAAIERDREAARRLGVAATPTILINDVMINGAAPADTLQVYVRRALGMPR